MGNVPKLRFEGFSGEWENHTLRDVAEIVTGSTPPTNDRTNYNGIFPFVSPGDIQGNRYIEHTSTTLTEKGFSMGRIIPAGSSLFVSIGSTIGKVAQIKKAATTNQQINAVVPQPDIDNDFIFSSLEMIAPEVRKIAATQAVPIVNKTTFGDSRLFLPSKLEQERVGKWFVIIDSFIALHQRKCDALAKAKRFYLQNLFPRKGARTPAIRFDGFSGDWERPKLGDVFTEYSEKNHPELPPLTIIQGGGTVLREESDRDLQYDKSSLSGYKLVLKDDFIVHLRSFEGGLEKANSDGIVSPAYHIFHGENTDARFFYPFFRSEYFINGLLKPFVYGIRDGRSIDIEGMKTIKISVPSIEEQKAIGSFIETLDTLIAQQNRKLTALKTAKQFLLQNMFPQED